MTDKTKTDGEILAGAVKSLVDGHGVKWDKVWRITYGPIGIDIDTDEYQCARCKERMPRAATFDERAREFVIRHGDHP